MGSTKDLLPRYPRLAAYLEGLPDGLASHPACEARSGVLETVLEAAPDGLDQAPPPLVAELLSAPRTLWLPEVRLEAALMAIADGAGMSDAAFVQWSRATYRHMYRRLVYRALMAFLSPPALLERAVARWEAFHRGSQLSLGPVGQREVSATLAFPSRTWTPLLLRGCGEAFAAALDNTRAEGVSVELVESTDRSGRFLARWR